MRPIGGYFEWEFLVNDGSFLHSDGMLLNSGRHSLEYILMSLELVNRIWVPYYTCDVVLQPIERLNIPYSFYHINTDFILTQNLALEEGEYLIYTNYFGIMDEYCQVLASRYGSQLILDNAQALYAPYIKGINSFYSPRKFVGIPDGGIAYADKVLDIEFKKDLSYDRCIHLLKRHDLKPMDGYSDFKENSQKIAGSPLSQMSTLTRNMLSSLDYESIKERRLSNFSFLHSRLACSNGLDLPSLDSFSCPMVYPYYAEDTDLRNRLIENHVYIATYWPNVLEWCNRDSIEFNLVKNIMALPIDQRYDINDMNYIIELIEE